MHMTAASASSFKACHRADIMVLVGAQSVSHRPQGALQQMYVALQMNDKHVKTEASAMSAYDQLMKEEAEEAAKPAAKKAKKLKQKAKKQQAQKSQSSSQNTSALESDAGPVQPDSPSSPTDLHSSQSKFDLFPSDLEPFPSESQPLQSSQTPASQSESEPAQIRLDAPMQNSILHHSTLESPQHLADDDSRSQELRESPSASASPGFDGHSDLVANRSVNSYDMPQILNGSRAAAASVQQSEAVAGPQSDAQFLQALFCCPITKVRHTFFLLSSISSFGITNLGSAFRGDSSGIPA